MVRKAIFILGALATSVFAQQAITIKGQMLGESIGDYLQAKDGGRELQKCREKESRKQHKTDSKKNHCQNLIAAVDDGVYFWVRPQYDEWLVFRRSRLVAIHLRHLYPFDQIMGDMKNRLGEPTKINDFVTQNAYGSTFHDPIVVWVQPDVSATMFQRTHWLEGVGYVQDTSLDVGTSEEMRQESAQEEARRRDALQ